MSYEEIYTDAYNDELEKIASSRAEAKRGKIAKRYRDEAKWNEFNEDLESSRTRKGAVANDAIVLGGIGAGIASGIGTIALINKIRKGKVPTSITHGALAGMGAGLVGGVMVSDRVTKNTPYGIASDKAVNKYRKYLEAESRQKKIDEINRLKSEL